MSGQEERRRLVAPRLLSSPLRCMLPPARQQAVALCRDAAEPSVAGDAWRVLAVVRAAAGEPAGARQACTEALAAYERASAAVQAQEVRQALAGIAG